MGLNGTVSSTLDKTVDSTLSESIVQHEITLFEDCFGDDSSIEFPAEEFVPKKRTKKRANRTAKKVSGDDLEQPRRKAKKKTKTGHDTSASNLWDKAIEKNPKLKEYVSSFNSQIEKVCQSDLSIREKD
ncbi:uncharacterized protein LOC141858646 [Brevipalpus obovatus]|uniref:uncharacterized protein LOC141858646 n=1 Tax=Brevipalpus obovatus TaxID=246614 RepID=UPI003D9E4ECF